MSNRNFNKDSNPNKGQSKGKGTNQDDMKRKKSNDGISFKKVDVCGHMIKEGVKNA